MLLYKLKTKTMYGRVSCADDKVSTDIIYILRCFTKRQVSLSEICHHANKPM